MYAHLYIILPLASHLKSSYLIFLFLVLCMYNIYTFRVTCVCEYSSFSIVWQKVLHQCTSNKEEHLLFIVCFSGTFHYMYVLPAGTKQTTSVQHVTMFLHVIFIAMECTFLLEGVIASDRVGKLFCNVI